MPDTSKASEALKSLVTPARVRLEEIASRCNVSRQAVSSWLRGDMQPSPERMRILEDEFGIPMRDWTFPPDPTDEPVPASEPSPKGETHAGAAE